jgi:hypothetical protein
MTEKEKRARKIVRAKLRAGIYTMPPLDHVVSPGQACAALSKILVLQSLETR